MGAILSFAILNSSDWLTRITFISLPDEITYSNLTVILGHFCELSVNVLMWVGKLAMAIS